MNTQRRPKQKWLALLLVFCLISQSALSIAADFGEVRESIPQNSGLGHSLTGPELSFFLTPQEMLGQYQEAEAHYQTQIQRVLSLPPDQINFENTAKALETASAEYSDKIQPLIFLSQVSPNPQIRETAERIEEKAQNFGNHIDREALYHVLRRCADQKENLDEKDAELLKSSLQSFESGGIGLKPEARERLQAIEERLGQISMEFQKNINENNDFIAVDEEGLKGLPKDYADGLKKDESGKYLVTLKYPDYVPFMQQAENASLRKQLEFKFNNRASEKNVPLLTEALRLRDESAKIQGYPSYPDMALEDRMAEKPENVWKFLNGLLPLLSSRGNAELQELLKIKQKDFPEAKEVYSWEKNYYLAKWHKAQSKIDEGSVKQYFPVNQVVEGTLKTYQKILGIKFSEIQNPDVWHKDVRAFEIRDAQTSQRIGHFYLDLYPRQGKFGHAAAFSLINGRELKNGYQKPVAAMVANLSPPRADRPALLNFDEVETFFHEFGHLMHQTLTKARYASFAGSNVALDFAEAPSQMMENFIWEPEVLNEISGHYQDPSRKLPQEILNEMKKSKKMGEALAYLRQLAQALADMTLHATVPNDANTLFNQIMGWIGLFPPQENTHPVASFGHLLGGYGAGYYAYLWSEVFADDLFSRFKKEGILNPQVGMDYRKKILEKGGERSEMESMKDFLGREPNNEAFLNKILN